MNDIPTVKLVEKRGKARTGAQLTLENFYDFPAQFPYPNCCADREYYPVMDGGNPMGYVIRDTRDYGTVTHEHQVLMLGEWLLDGVKVYSEKNFAFYWEAASE